MIPAVIPLLRRYRSPALAFVTGVIALGALGWVGFVYFDNDALYADVSRTMVGTGDWLNPNIHGVAFLDKPPLFFWVLAAFMSVFGEAVAILRAPAVLAGAATLAVVAAAASEPEDDVAAPVLAVLMVLAVPLFVGYCRRVYMEVPVALCVVAAIVAYDRAGKDRRWYLVAGALVGCGFMIKSLVGLFGLIPFGALLLLRRRWGVLRDPWFWGGIALCAVLVVPWHAYQLAANTDVFLEFTWKLHVEKQILEAQPWSTGPPWFYLQALIVDAPVLGLCVFVGLARVGYLLAKRRVVPDLDIHLVLALGVMLAVFSASETKKLLYLIVIVAPAAILAGRAVVALMPRRAFVWATAVVLILVSARSLPFYLPQGDFLQGNTANLQIDVGRAAGAAAAPDDTIFVLDNYFSTVQFEAQRPAVSYWHNQTLVAQTQRIPYIQHGKNMRAVPPAGAVPLVTTIQPALWVLRATDWEKLKAALPKPLYADANFVLVDTRR
jgi:4-amino-4-deoxy-L-arabinose transferase-like glycosyltransferase